MCAEGYAAVTSRHVATQAGLEAPACVLLLPHDGRFVSGAVSAPRRSAALTHLETVLAAPYASIHTLWKIFCEPANGALNAEFMALANHRKIIGDEIARQAEQVRALQAELLTRVLRERGIDTEKYPPVVIAMLLATLSQVLIRRNAASA